MAGETVGELERRATSGVPMRCAKCRRPTPAEDCLSIRLRMDVEGLALWNKSTRPYSVAVVVTPVCPACAERMVPADGQEITL